MNPRRTARRPDPCERRTRSDAGIDIGDRDGMRAAARYQIDSAGKSGRFILSCGTPADQVKYFCDLPGRLRSPRRPDRPANVRSGAAHKAMSPATFRTLSKTPKGRPQSLRRHALNVLPALPMA